MLAYFINRPKSEYFQTQQFMHIITTLQQLPGLATMKEKHSNGNEEDEASLMLRFNDVKSVQTAMKKLKVLLPESSLQLS